MEQIDHNIYKRVSESEADGCAWVFVNPDKLEKYYFKHPELKPYEIRIRVISSGICMSDIKMGRKKWGQPIYPLCTGHEVAGEIVEMGKEVENMKLKERVMVGPFRNSCQECEFCTKDMQNYCIGMDFGERKLYAKYWGGHSTHIHLHYKLAYKIPESLDVKTIPPLMCAGITTFLPLFEHAKKGDKLAVIGFGGLGSYAVQWGVKLGCHVDVFSSSNSKKDMVKKMGGEEVILWTEGDHLKTLNHYDIMINTLPCEINKEQLNGFLSVLKPRGKFIQVGLCDKGTFLEIDPFLLVVKGISVIGSDVGGNKDYQEMLDFVGKHGVESICEIFKWDDYEKGIERIEKGQPILRCVLDVDTVSQSFQKE